MQYPIIDLITSAYINNGWTGLELTEGKNLFNPSLLIITGYIDTNGVYNPSNAWRTTDFLRIKPNTTYTFNPNQTAGDAPKFVVYDENKNPVQVLSSGLITFTTVANSYYYRPSIRYNSVNIQLEYGSVATSYEPYTVTTDMFSRTRFPIIRYFPYSVIDSLQRASVGEMTVDDVQVLRHYLSKFGVGNIELGRFHAIRQNNEENKAIGFEDEKIPIDDFPIEEKKSKGDD